MNKLLLSSKYHHGITRVTRLKDSSYPNIKRKFCGKDIIKEDVNRQAVRGSLRIECRVVYALLSVHVFHTRKQYTRQSKVTSTLIQIFIIFSNFFILKNKNNEFFGYSYTWWLIFYLL